MPISVMGTTICNRCEAGISLVSMKPVAARSVTFFFSKRYVPGPLQNGRINQGIILCI